ncbi:MICOS complex subunit MIC60-1-like [Tachypleus tridentatus]|uniref:MICOS complex subunit MIC60-1-like n=1 Tax=Tachypleus tridentatus TaxID=6853 RepID=UPI003FD2FDC4
MKEPAADEKLEEVPISKTQSKELSAKKRTDDKKTQEKVLKEVEAVSLNRAIEERIVSKQESLERLAQDVVAAQVQAVEAVKQHTKKLYKALDELSDADDKSMWVEINAASEARDKALNNASTTAANIKANIEELKAVVADGRADMLTAQNSSLLQAEEAISRVLYQIQTAETEVAKALGESKVVNEYKDIIEKGKEQFKKELEAILPDVKLGQQVNEENLNILIAHAYRRVEHLQRQLAKQAVTEQNRVQKAMENQKEEDSKIADTQVSIELANQQREQEIAHQKGINDLKEELELELRQQLQGKQPLTTTTFRKSCLPSRKRWIANMNLI